MTLHGLISLIKSWVRILAFVWLAVLAKNHAAVSYCFLALAGAEVLGIAEEVVPGAYTGTITETKVPAIGFTTIQPEE